MSFRSSAGWVTAPLRSISESRRWMRRAPILHPLLGPRLHAACAALATASGSAVDILGPVDAMKLRSSMTLFARAADDPAPFQAIIDRFFDGPDPATAALLPKAP